MGDDDNYLSFFRQSLYKSSHFIHTVKIKTAGRLMDLPPHPGFALRPAIPSAGAPSSQQEKGRRAVRERLPGLVGGGNLCRARGDSSPPVHSILYNVREKYY